MTFEYPVLPINWALCTSAAQLFEWREKVLPAMPVYHVIKYGYPFTGFEVNKGHCWWCDADLTGKQGRKFCTAGDLKAKHGHGLEYIRHFGWQYAAPWCHQRQKHACANCGKAHYGLEIHHIIPLEGETRLWSPFNLPWNLIGLCHECHLEIGMAMRLPKKHEWEKRVAAGQMPLLQI